MSTFLTLLPALLIVPFYALLIKLASRLYRRSQVAWKHAFAFGALGMALGVCGTLVNLATGNVLPSVLAAALGIGVQVALGGWFLGPRAVAVSGAPVAFAGGAAIAAIAAVVSLVFAVVVAVAVSALLPHGQA
jgi:hypothetical protein